MEGLEAAVPRYFAFLRVTLRATLEPPPLSWTVQVFS